MLKSTDPESFAAGRPGQSAYQDLFSGEDPSFDAILGETCGRLEKKRNQGVFKRIQKMEDILERLENELTVLVEEKERQGV